jgi:hypothetical protein
MGKITKSHRHNVIKQRQKRLKKIKKLRARLQNADLRSREIIIQKLKKIHAAVVPEETLR